MKTLTVTFCLLAAVCCLKGTTVTGYEGQNVTVECSDFWASTNAKYFCGGRCTDDHDVLIKTENGQTYQEKWRFSLRDTGTETFYVTISDLKKTDTGTYWCGLLSLQLHHLAPLYSNRVEDKLQVPADIYLFPVGGTD
ncbi:CMRF35-like molecule 6 [Arapaima gigas]